MNAPPLTIRSAMPGDAKRLAELSGQLGYPRTREEILRHLSQLQEDPEHAVYVAETLDGKVMGWLHVFVSPLLEVDAQAEVGGLVVDEAQRGHGAGRLLLQQAEQWAREKGCRTVCLRCNVIRTGAHAFYEKLGYQTIKSQKVFRKSL
ncbi:MAG: GNAT family N-acetyltransferase [Terriglobia bacterium]